MKTLAFIYSGMISIIGVIMLLITKMTNLIMPKIGLSAFQSAASGSYSPDAYYIDFSTVNTFSVLMIILGIAGCILLSGIVKTKKKEDNS